MSRKTLGEKLAGMTEDERGVWAGDRMEEITDEYAIALHIGGWKIVNQDPNGHKWPIISERLGCGAPPWCDDLDTPAKAVNVFRSKSLPMPEQPLALTDDQMRGITVAARSPPQSRRDNEAQLKGLSAR